MHDVYMVGGAAAAAPKGDALAGMFGLTPHFLVVGDGDPIAVPLLARVGPRWDESGSCDSCDMHLLGSHRNEGF
jgi:hypothetical protein